MNPEQISIAIGLGAFILSVGTSIFIAGSRWASLKSDIDHVKLQLAEIRGMFVLKLRDDEWKGR